MSEPSLTEIEEEIKKLVQINNIENPLDSLESMVIKSYLNSLYNDAFQAEFPKENTIRGWLQCLNQYLHAGQIPS